MISPLGEIDPFTDLGNYFSFWEELNSSNLLDVLFRYEPGFVLFCKFLSIFVSFSGFSWVVQWLVFYSTYLFFSVYARDEVCAVIGALLCYFFYPPTVSFSETVLRQGLATAIFFCWLIRVQTKNLRLRSVLPWAFAMVLVHYSSIFALVGIAVAIFIKRNWLFYIWLVALIAYCFNLSGEVGLHIYEMFGLNVATLNALTNYADLEYSLGFKLGFLLLSLFFVVAPVSLVALRSSRAVGIALLSNYVFRLYFALNASATIFSLMPFNDRFFLWSWAIGPAMILGALSRSGVFSSSKKLDVGYV